MTVTRPSVALLSHEDSHIDFMPLLRLAHASPLYLAVLVPQIAQAFGALLLSVARDSHGAHGARPELKSALLQSD